MANPSLLGIIVVSLWAVATAPDFGTRWTALAISLAYAFIGIAQSAAAFIRRGHRRLTSTPG